MPFSNSPMNRGATLTTFGTLCRFNSEPMKKCSSTLVGSSVSSTLTSISNGRPAIVFAMCWPIIPQCSSARPYFTAARRKRIGRSADDFLRRALSAFHFADGLLGEEGGELEFLERRVMTGRRDAEPVAEAEGFFETERRRRLCVHNLGMPASVEGGG